jgi:hypothetical protein
MARPVVGRDAWASKQRKHHLPIHSPFERVGLGNWQRRQRWRHKLAPTQ